MGKTVILKLTSELCEEEIKVPEELWKRFEDRAREVGTPIEHLFQVALNAFLKDKGV